jgi:hypothetical protein
MLVDIEKVNKIYSLLYTLRDVNEEIRGLEIEVGKILEASVDLGIPADVIRGVEVEIEKRPLKKVELAPLRCEETSPEIYINRVVIENYSLVLIGANKSRREIRLTSLDVHDALTLACNLEVSEVEALINAVREKKKLLEEDLAKLKELVAYTKLVLS